MAIDANMKDHSWRIPLHVAAANGHDSVVNLLLSHDDIDGIYPL
jgi:ankyrin repeat protein